MRKLIGSTGVLVVASAIALGAGSATAAAPLSPNTSIIFLKPGHAITGTFSGGVFTHPKSLLTGSWTAAAASRDSLALYNRNTGKLQIGIFRAGAWTPKATLTLLTGYTHVVASCDTVAFVKSSGIGFTAKFKQGKLGARTAFNIGTGAQLLSASCDTLVVHKSAADYWGSLTNGLFSLVSYGFGDARQLLVATDDSYLELASTTGGDGFWGTLTEGDRHPLDDAHGFGAWDVVAGTADSILFYNRQGITARATLSGGNYAYSGLGQPNLAAGWVLIAGGK